MTGVLKQIVRGVLHRFGVDLVRHRSPRDANLRMDERLGFDLEDEATAAIRVVRDHTMLSKRRLVTLYQQVAYCERNGISVEVRAEVLHEVDLVDVTLGDRRANSVHRVRVLHLGPASVPVSDREAPGRTRARADGLDRLLDASADREGRRA